MDIDYLVKKSWPISHIEKFNWFLDIELFESLIGLWKEALNPGSLTIIFYFGCYNKSNIKTNDLSELGVILVTNFKLIFVAILLDLWTKSRKFRVFVTDSPSSAENCVKNSFSKKLYCSYHLHIILRFAELTEIKCPSLSILVRCRIIVKKI